MLRSIHIGIFESQVHLRNPAAREIPSPSRGENVNISPLLGEVSTARIAIIDDETPGTFVLEDELVRVCEADGKVQLTVMRVGGCKGLVSLCWTTKDGTALAGDDYVATKGVLQWEHHDVSPKVIEIEIVDSIGYEPQEYFEVVFSDATGGATFDASTDGNAQSSIARIIILEDYQARTIRDRAIDLFSFNRDRTRLRIRTWRDQLVEAVRPHC